MEKDFQPQIYADRYLLIDRLGRGAMAEVFLAVPIDTPRLDRAIALKRLFPHIAEDQLFVDQLVAEAKLCSLFDHENIIRCIDVAPFGDSYYAEYAWVDGLNGRQLVLEMNNLGEKLAPAAVLYIFRRLGEALDYTHNAQDRSGRPLSLVHRDISPENVVIGFDGSVKLIDFGLAAAAQTNQQSKEVVRGKISFMAPEQLDSEQGGISAALDRYSITMVFAFLLIGRELIDGKDEHDIRAKITNATFDKLTDRRTDLAAGIDTLFQSISKLKPEERPGTCSLMSNKLSGLLDEFNAEEFKEYLDQHLSNYRSELAKIYQQRIDQGVELINNFLEFQKRSAQMEQGEGAAQQTAYIGALESEVETQFNTNPTLKERGNQKPPEPQELDKKSSEGAQPDLEDYEQPETLAENSVRSEQPRQNLEGEPQSQAAVEPKLELVNDPEPIEPPLEEAPQSEPAIATIPDPKPRPAQPSRKRVERSSSTGPNPLLKALPLILLGVVVGVGAVIGKRWLIQRFEPLPMLYGQTHSVSLQLIHEPLDKDQSSILKRLTNPESGLKQQISKFLFESYSAHTGKNDLNLVIDIAPLRQVEQWAPTTTSIFQPNAVHNYFEQTTMTDARYTIWIYLYRQQLGKSRRYPLEFLESRRTGRGVVFLPLFNETVDYAPFAVVHELLHIAGASDKFDEEGAPYFPEGYANPKAKPLHPQAKGEIMARSRVSGPEKDQRLPIRTLDEAAIGVATAAELGWISAAQQGAFYAAF